MQKTYTSNFNIFIFIILLFFGILPGLIYLAFTMSSYTETIETDPGSLTKFKIIKSNGDILTFASYSEAKDYCLDQDIDLKRISEVNN